MNLGPQNFCRTLQLAGVAFGGALLLTGAGCSRGGEGQVGGKQAGRSVVFPVEVQAVASADVEYVVNAVGTVEAFEKVQVTARVSGVVERVSFREGDHVKVGQSLVTIEPQRFKLAADALRAAVEKARAGRADSDAGLQRRQAAVEKTPGLIPGEEVATWKTRVRTAAAEEATAEALLAQAELNLRDAYVRAPVSGAIETRTVQTGQYVQPGGVLATLIQRDPLLLRFGVPAAEARQLRRGMKANFSVERGERKFSAVISHVGEAADQNSRMVIVTAEVESPAGAAATAGRPLRRSKAAPAVPAVDAESAGPRPGAFAEITVPLSTRRATPVIPETAIRPSEKGFVAYVVVNNRAEQRILHLGLRTPDGRVEVTGGLVTGDQVVIRGAEALQAGVVVKVDPPQTRSGGVGSAADAPPPAKIPPPAGASPVKG